MQLPSEKKNLTVQEAADELNVRRERVWKLMADGVLTAERSKLDGRQKLIPREQVEALLLEEGYRPRRTVRRSMSRELEVETPGTVEGEGRIWPKSIGMASDGTVPSDQSEAYMRQQLHGEPTPPQKKNVTVQEAADMLNVRRERVWKLVSDGVLSAAPSKLDGRQKLIPREQVEQLLLEEGYRPRRTVRRASRDGDVPESGSLGDAMIAPTGQASESRLVRQDTAHAFPEWTGSGSDPTLGSTANEVARREDPDANPGTVRRLPRTIGVVEDESFQASESEAYMHEHRNHERVSAE